MKKTKRSIGKGRMTPANIAAVVAEIEAYGRGERKATLSWALLEEFSGFSHVALWQKEPIRAVFRRVKQDTRADATPPIKTRRTGDERIVRMQGVIDELREIVRTYDEQWALYEHNVHRLGLDAEELRCPLGPIERRLVKARRPRVIR